MRIRRVFRWDFFHEDDNPEPTVNWTAVDGEWDIVTRALRANHDVGPIIGTAYWTLGLGATDQNKRLKYDIDFDVQQTSPAWWAAIIIQGSAQAGRYLGNSIVITIDASNVTIYTSAANALTQRGQVAHAHSSGNTYRMEVDFDPTSGEITIYEDDNLADARPEATTSILNVPSIPAPPWIGRTEVGLAAENCILDFRWFQMHRPDFDQIVDGSVSYSKFISKRPSLVRFAIPVDDDKSITPEFQKHNMVELIVEDFSTQHREFFGLIEKTDWDTSTGLLWLEGRDTLQQMVVNEADHNTGGAVQQSAQIKNIFTGNTDDLPTIDVKTAGDNYENDYEGRSVWEVVGTLARQLGHGVWQDKDRKVMITDVYAASGITIDNDDDNVLDAQDIEDIYDLCNTAHIYHQAGDDLQSDGASQAIYGNRGGVLYGATRVDKEILAAGQAQDEGDFWVNHYKDPVEALYIQVADYHELDIGETVTLNIDHLGLTGASALCVEKHYEDGKPFFTFHFVIYTVNPLLRLSRDPGMTQHDGKRLASDANAWQA